MTRSEIITVGFANVLVHIHDTFVLSVFRGGGIVARHINAADDWLAGVARSCGYDDMARYARHLDLTHHWLAHQRGGFSAALYAEAFGDTAPYAEAERHQVNCLQRIWADRLVGAAWGKTPVTAARDALGEDWRQQIVSHWHLLDAVA